MRFWPCSSSSIFQLRKKSLSKYSSMGSVIHQGATLQRILVRQNRKRLNSESFIRTCLENKMDTKLHYLECSQEKKKTLVSTVFHSPEFFGQKYFFLPWEKKICSIHSKSSSRPPAWLTDPPPPVMVISPQAAAVKQDTPQSGIRRKESTSYK